MFTAEFSNSLDDSRLVDGLLPQNKNVDSLKSAT
jgi:hypothetical protein